MPLCVVFGVDLETLLLRESADNSIAPGTIPRVVQRLIDEVESRGLTEVGICKWKFINESSPVHWLTSV